MSPAATAFQPVRAVLVAACFVALLAASGAIERGNQWWFDTLQAMAAGQAPLPPDTALVLIDEQALNTLGGAPFSMRWPWPRSAFAALLSGLQAAGARQIVVDLIFFEQSAAAEQDLLLGAVAAGLPGVILATVPGRIPVVWPQEFLLEHKEEFEGRTKWGFVRSSVDPDSVVRRYYPAGSLAAAALPPGITPSTAVPDTEILLRWRGNLEQLRARQVPALSAAPFVVAGWRILDQATQYAPDLDPAGLGAAILQAPPLAGAGSDDVRGKTVFVGANAAATFDAIATPLGAPEPGVILQWNAYASLLAGDFIQLGWPPLIWLATLVALIFPAVAGNTSNGLTAPATAAIGLAVVIIAVSAAGFLAGTWFAPGLPVLATAIAFVAATVERFRMEHARKQEIQGWFGAYVSPAVVDRLLADPGAIELGGEQRELTIMFSDIAGFTTISERLSPPELVALINRFLEGQTERILDHGGYLDKYIGDAVMSVFGSPEEIENHALAACRAALACRAELSLVNQDIESRYGVRLGMRTGINTGDVVVGNVGSTRKRNYTVLGDAVNLASRLEGANKQTGTSILLGPVTAARANDAMILRPVARLQVKGKTQAEEVFELMAERTLCDAATSEFAELFTRGFGAYTGKNFTGAAEFFARAAKLRPGDALSAHYMEEARVFADRPPGPDWQAILKLETK